MFWPYIFVLILLIPILAIVLDSQVGRALASRLERGRVSPGDDVDKERIQVLEAELERLAGEVDRLSEESDFLHRLLTEGTGGDDGDPPPGQRDRPG
jgi:hypothetical protein